MVLLSTTAWRKLALAFSLVLGLPTASAQIQSPETLPDFYQEPGLQPNRDFVNQHVTEHIDPFTGALQIHSTDVHIPGPAGFDLNVVRSFNSNRINPLNPADATTNSLAGHGWTIHFGRVLKRKNFSFCLNNDFGVAIGDNPILELPDGSRQPFTFASPTGSPLMLTTQRWKAECLNGEHLSVYSPAGVRYDMEQLVLEAPGVYALYTTRITDRNGNSMAISYASANSPEITTVLADDGRHLTFRYFSPGTADRRLRSITDNSSRTWRYEYVALQNVVGRHLLRRAYRPDGPEGGQTSWEYTYYAPSFDSANNYQLHTLTHPFRGRTTYLYGHVNFDYKTDIYTRSVVVKRKTSSMTTTNGGVWTFTYNVGSLGVNDETVVVTPAGQITYRHVGANTVGSGSVWRIGLLMEKITGNREIETLTWDAQAISNENNLRAGAFPSLVDNQVMAPILEQKRIVRDGVTYLTQYSNHDTYGNPGTIVESGPSGGNRTTNLTYYINPALWVIRQVDDEITATVGAIRRTQDPVGNVLSETVDGVLTRYTYHATGDVLTKRSPRGFVSRFTQYKRGIPRVEVHPEGVTINRTVSSAGNVESETDGEQNTLYFEYDGLNRLTSVGSPHSFGTVVIYGQNGHKLWLRGRRDTGQSSTDGFGRPWSFFDSKNWFNFRHDALGRTTFASVNGSATVGKEYTYDILNRVETIVNTADGGKKTYTYGYADGAATTSVRDERGHLTTYFHRAYGDPSRALVMRVDAPGGAADVQLDRNGRGQVTSATQGSAARFVTRTFGYDSRYYLTSVRQPEIEQTLYGRDDAGNMTSKQIGQGPVSVFEYDQLDRLWRITYGSGAPSQVTKTYWRTGRLKTVANATATRSFDYDANLNLISEAISVDGLTLRAGYRYDDYDQVDQITYPVLGNAFDFAFEEKSGLLRSVSTGSRTLFNVGFGSGGRLAQVNFAGGTTLQYFPDAQGRLGLLAFFGIERTYGYDLSGNLVSIADGYAPTSSSTFTYDALNRLQTFDGPWGTGTATYDGVGNIHSQTRQGTPGTPPIRTTNEYDASNRLQSVATFVIRDLLSRRRALTDARGNISFADNPFIYDEADNLVSGGGAQYFNDGGNTRVKTVRNGVTTYEFRSVSGQLLAEWQKQPGMHDVLQEHVYVAGRRLAQQRTQFIPGSTADAPSWMFLVPDATGAPIASALADGTVLFKESYEPYGRAVTGAAAQWTSAGIGGHTAEPGSMVYMGGRYYDSSIGRFMSMDPAMPEPADFMG